MSKILSKRTRSFAVFATVLVLTFLLVVPYGNHLMDRAASLMDPMRYKVIFAIPTNESDQSALRIGSVLLRKPTDDGNDSSVAENAVKNATSKMSSTPASNFTAIIILTYMRSGSSMTGEIMQQHPDTFYVFEPLHSLQHVYNSKSPLEFLNGTSLDHGKYNWTEIAAQTLRSWFTCDLRNMYKKGFMDKQFLSYGKKTAFLPTCLQNTSNKANSLDNCVMKLRDLCMKSKFRVLKTIRASMRQIMDVMRELPELKVIHLVRDPRDTMMSQKARAICGKGSPDELASCSARYCYRLSDDIVVSEKEDIFRNRVLPVLYEDIAFRTEELSSKMYSFAGIELTEDIKKYVHRLTGNASKSGCKVCQEKWQVGQSKKDAMSHVEKWRTTMPAQFRVIVDILCKDSLKHFNYSVLNPFWLT